VKCSNAELLLHGALLICFSSPKAIVSLSPATLPSLMPALTKLGHCVYVLFSEADGKLYIGYTSNLKQRLTDHFNGRNQATAPRRPLRLIYCEYHASTTDAHRREKYFKTTAGKKALNLMLRDALSGIRN
jgi:putative endonuclease